MQDHQVTTLQATPGNPPVANQDVRSGSLSFEGVQGGTVLDAVETLEPEQQTYLGAIRQKRRQSVAISHANITPPILAKWRLDPLFASLEASIKAKAWGIGKALARDTAEAHAHEHVLALHALAFNRDPETGERMQTPILSRTRDGTVEVVGHEDAVKPQERIKAHARILEVAGNLGASGQQGLSVNMIQLGQGASVTIAPPPPPA